MIIESEHGDPTVRNNQPYDFEGPLAAVDHQIFEVFANFLAMH
jgi:hypothetical protein